MYRGYYRRQKGFDGRLYRVNVPEREVRGLVVTIVTLAAAAALVLSAAAFAAGLSLR